jgi:hypothetical protein
MDKVLLGVILVVAVSVLVRILWRSVARAKDPSKPSPCGGCPFDSKCEMQNQPHASEHGSTADDS